MAKQMEELDLVFICDCTGSMGSYIKSAKENITSIIEQIQASEQRDVQFALIAYRDHPPQEKTYITQVFEFTSSVRKAKEYVETMTAHGGGDAPEAVSAALHEALNLPYRKNATKIVVIVADAPCHGLTSHISDGFPDGSPDGADPIIDSRVMAERNIVLYSVGCEPLIGRNPFACDFFRAIAQVTGGRYISLGNAGVLPKVIIGGAEEEIHLNKVGEEVEKEAALVQAEADEKKEELSEEMLYTKVTERLQSRGISTAQLKVDDIGASEETTEISRKIAECDDLKAVKAMLDKDYPAPVRSQKKGAVKKEGMARKSRSKAGSSKDTKEKRVMKRKEEKCCEGEKEETEAVCERLPSCCPSSSSSSSSSAVSYMNQEARTESAAISYSQVSRWMGKKKYASKGK